MTAPIRSQSELLERDDARDRGLLRYFTGKACKHGHIAERHVSTGICLECGAMHQRLRWKLNPEHMRAKERSRIAADLAGNRERVKAWRKANPEKRRAAARRHNKKHAARKKEYRAANAGRLKQRAKAYYEANKDLYAARSRNRTARKKKAEGSHTAADLRIILKSQRGKCAYCPTSIKLRRHVDHIVPLAKGGTNWPSNIQLTCPPCNLSKGKTDPIDFAQRLGMLL
jgi:5-methylcytosine-specific restriction endonuclease McrA